MIYHVWRVALTQQSAAITLVTHMLFVRAYEIAIIKSSIILSVYVGIYVQTHPLIRPIICHNNLLWMYKNDQSDRVKCFRDML